MELDLVFPPSPLHSFFFSHLFVLYLILLYSYNVHCLYVWRLHTVLFIYNTGVCVWVFLVRARGGIEIFQPLIIMCHGFRCRYCVSYNTAMLGISPLPRSCLKNDVRAFHISSFRVCESLTVHVLPMFLGMKAYLFITGFFLCKVRCATAGVLDFSFFFSSHHAFAVPGKWEKRAERFKGLKTRFIASSWSPLSLNRQVVFCRFLFCSSHQYALY